MVPGSILMAAPVSRGNSSGLQRVAAGGVRGPGDGQRVLDSDDTEYPGCRSAGGGKRETGDGQHPTDFGSPDASDPTPADPESR